MEKVYPQLTYQETVLHSEYKGKLRPQVLDRAPSVENEEIQRGKDCSDKKCWVKN